MGGKSVWWVRREPPRRKGAIGELLVKAWARHEGVQVAPPSDPGHDLTLNEIRAEVKFSLLWESGDYVFQQLREQSYEVVCLLGLEPQSVAFWIAPKEIVWEHATGQHTGAEAQDTKWLRFRAARPPHWLRPYGGTLADALSALEEARGRLRS